MKKKYNFLSKYIICVLPLMLSACSFSFGGFSKFGEISNSNSVTNSNETTSSSVSAGQTSKSSSEERSSSSTELPPESSSEESSSSESEQTSSSENESSSSEESSSSSSNNEFESEALTFVNSMIKTPIKIRVSEDEVPVVERVIESFNEKQMNESMRFRVEIEILNGLEINEIVYGSSNDLFDLALLPDDLLWTSELIKNKAEFIKEVPEIFENEIKETNFDYAYKGSLSGDSLVGFPAYTSNGYFNWVDKNYIPEGCSLEQMLQIARDYNKKVSLALSMSWYASAYLFSPQGIGPDSLEWKKLNDSEYKSICNWDNDVANHHLSYLQDLFIRYSDVIFTGSIGVGGVLEGDLIAGFNGAWMREEFNWHETSDRIVPRTLPYYTLGGYGRYNLANFVGCNTYVATSRKNDPAKEETALALAYLLTTETAQIERMKLREDCPPTNINAFSTRTFDEEILDCYKVLAQQSVNAGVSQAYVIGNNSRCWEAFDAINHALLGDYQYSSWLFPDCKSIDQILKETSDHLNITYVY